MEFDLMTGGLTWKESAELAVDLESAGFSGMLFTEAGSVPWMMKAGDIPGMANTISDEILAHFSLAARWDDMADALRNRYAGVATRIVTYLAMDDLRRNPKNLPKWGEISQALRSA